jgi:3'(2'), 5'-bisphosphate nucleotidase
MEVNLSLCMQVVHLAKAVSEKLLEIYANQEKLLVQTKIDNTPVTSADLQAHTRLVQGLKQLTPEIPVLSEESATEPFAIRQTWPMYWLIDPLDGTKEFLMHTDDFSINIALIENHQPILSVIAIPAHKLIYYAIHQQAWKLSTDLPPERIGITKNKAINIAVISRTHHQAEENYLQENFNIKKIIRAGSAYKFCLVAEGKANIYLRLSPTYEWDTAAGQGILTAAGGQVRTLDGQVLTYNTKENLLNPYFIAEMLY